MNSHTPDPTHPAVDDPRPIFARAVAIGGATIAAVRPDQMDAATPCDDFDVRSLIGHLTAVLGRVKAIGDGTDPMVMPFIIEGVADDGWAAAWEDAARAVLNAWTDDATLTRMVVLPWATMPGAATLATYTSEVTVHTWDLANATGQSPAWDDEVIGVSMTAMQMGLPDGDREAEFEAMRGQLPPALRDVNRPFGNATPVPDGARPIDRLVAWTGRRP